MRTVNERTRGEEKVQTKSERDLHHFLRGYGREDKRRLEKRVGKRRNRKMLGKERRKNKEEGGRAWREEEGNKGYGGGERE